MARSLMTIPLMASLALGGSAGAQESAIAYVPAAGVTVSGSLAVRDGRVAIGNNGTISSGASPAVVSLARGGELTVCASTTVHLSRVNTIAGDDSALMIALNHGAVEASYRPGKFSDVLLTPDFRILISGPGAADLKVRVSRAGDTCIDNHGANAPYVTVTSQFAGGLYRVQPGQRVMFEDGSLSRVVDNESEPCGCPPSTPTAASRAEAKNPFPLAQSEGLSSAPKSSETASAPVGTVETEVSAPITYDARETPNPEISGAAGAAPSEVARSIAAPIPNKHRSVFRAIGHFFAKMFGK